MKQRDQFIRVDGRLVRLAPFNRVGEDVAARCPQISAVYDRGFYRQCDPMTVDALVGVDVTAPYRAARSVR